MQSGSYVSLGVYRVNALALDPNHLGIMLCVPILLLIPFSLRAGLRSRRGLVLAGLLGFFLVVDVLTLSRSGFLGLACGLAILAWPLRRQLLVPRLVVPVAAGARGDRPRAGLVAVRAPGRALARDGQRQLGQGALPVLRPRAARAGRASGVRPRPEHVLGLLRVPDGQDQLGPALVLHRVARRDGPGRRRRVRGVPGLGRAAAGGDPARLARARSASATSRPATGTTSPSGSAQGWRPR